MKRYNYTLVFILLYIWGGGTVCAQVQQDYVVTTRRLSAETGMVPDDIVCGLQDTSGFIWLGTPDGLQRYDGAQFKLFTSEKNGLQGNYIRHLALGADGFIWITYGSARERAGGMVDLMNAGSGKVVPFTKAFGAKAPFGEREIFLVLANEVGDIFIITFASDVWMYRCGRFRKVYDHPAPLFFPRAKWHHKVKGGHLWLSTADMGCVYADTLGNWRLMSYAGSAEIDPLTIYPDGHALVWIAFQPKGTHTRRPAFALAGTDGQMRQVQFDPYLNDSTSRYDDYYLFGMWDNVTGCLGFQNRNAGISLLLPDVHTTIQVVDPASMAPLNNALLNGSFSDASGKFWFCTAKGVFIADVRPNNFRHFLDKTQLKTPVMMGNQARGICKTAAGSTWAAIWDGMYQFDDLTGTVLKRVPGRNPTIIYEDGAQIWAATRDSLIDLARGVPAMTLPGRLGVENEIWALHRHGGRLYAGTIRGIWDISGPQATWRQVEGTGAGTDGWCYGFFPARDGSVWVATTKGLLRLEEGKITDRYAKDATDSAHRIPCTDIHYLYEDSTGGLWLCTNDEGLVHWERREKRFERYTIADGLSSNKLYALLPDGQGYYWISSARGLMRFDPVSKAVNIYTVKDGLADNEFNRLSACRTADGRMYFGGVNGLISFAPAELNAAQAKAYLAPVRVSGLYHYNPTENQLEDKTLELLRTNTIEIKPGDGAYTLSFQLLDFETQGHNYAYKIEGLEARWSYITESSLRLSNLPYGNYTLRVKGRQTGGTCSTRELVIKLQVVRPVYLRAWFVIIALTIAGCVVWLLIRWWQRRLLLANEQLEITVAERTAQLAQMLGEKDLLVKEIHHRVKNNLQVISSLQQMQASRSQHPAVREALADSQNRVLSIAFIHQNLYQHEGLKGVEMQSFVSELIKHVLEVCTDAEKNISVTQDIAPVTLDIDTAVPTGLILNELLTNSCKHAFRNRKEGHIAVHLEETVAGQYRLEYSDDGPGLGRSFDFGKSESMGLRLISRLADQLDGKLQYEHAPANRFVIIIKDFKTRNAD